MKSKVRSNIDLKELEKLLGIKGLEKEFKNMSLERRKLMLELIEKWVGMDTDELILELRYIIYVKNTKSANRRSFENLNLGFSKGDSVA